ncbi:MAG TPA: hypothetical protein VIO94_07645 [Phenylobacterium sp.]
MTAENVNIEDVVREAIAQELNRQAQDCADLSMRPDGPRTFLEGPVDVDALAMAVVGAVAGGP